MIPPKPHDAIWNDQQWQAIYAKKEEILISAGAGSGKTAVLVERIIQKVMNEQVNVDELLVLTFTEAAAAEMKERIRQRIETELKEQPALPHLNAQLNKLPRAQISTFHAFCSTLIRHYYYLLDIDPVISIADDIEVGLIQDEVMESLFDGLSEEGDREFLTLVESFNSDRNDEDLKTMLLKIYEQARANPQMQDWLERLSDLYEWDGENLSSWVYYETFQKLSLPYLEAASNDLAQASLYAAEAAISGVPHKYTEEVYPLDMAYLQRLKTSGEAYGATQSSWARFPAMSKKLYDKELHELANDYRKSAKKQLDKVKNEFFGYSTLTHQLHFKNNQATAQALSRLVLLFHEHFLAAKKNRRLLDFSDLEWYALELLLQKGEPTEVAKETYSRFKEIMIDEYQDTNSMQETIIMAVAKAQNPPVPVFMVGDVKQSIYRFRLAEPSIFRQKYNTYSNAIEDDSPNLKIDLMENYRSHRQIIDSTNFVFSQIMDEPVGEISYDEAAKLRLGVLGEPEPDFNATEIHLLDTAAEGGDEAEELSAVEKEAYHIGITIKNWLAGQQEIYDRKSKSFKPLSFKDIVILMRSLTHVTTYQDVFRKLDLPLFTETTTDLLSSIEILNILSCLRVIDNPYQDIPLAGLMRSPLFFFDERELSLIKSTSEATHFYDRVRSYAKDGPDSALVQKVSDFLERIHFWRFESVQSSLSRLISLICEQTLYYEFVLSLPHGTLRKANLDVFLDRARQYEVGTKKGLYGFISHIERMQHLGKHFGKAKTVTANEDVVRIMSIHKSKGLEFPVVFVSGLQKLFNRMDEIGNYILHKDYGVALKYIDPDLRIKQKTIAQHLVSNILRKESLAEEMRLLYVAMTRAKSKLIFTGSFHVEKKLNAFAKALTGTDTLLPAPYRMQSKSYGDFILPAALRHKSLEETVQSYGLEVSHALGDDSTWKLKVFSELEPFIEKIENESPDVLSPPLIDLEKAFNKFYEYQELVGISAKQSVSQRKAEETAPLFSGIYMERQATVYDRPTFMQELETTAAEAGTALHQFMQHLPVKKAWDLGALEELRQRLVEKEILKPEVANVLNLDQVLAFTQTPLYEELCGAGRIKKEVPFMTLIRVGEVEQSNVLLQGVIDLLAEFGDRVYIVDYKTDFVKNFDAQKDMLKERYRIQMKYYQKAMKEIFPNKDVICHVYFLKAGREIVYDT